VALPPEANRIQSAVDDYQHYLKTAPFKGADEAETVEVTLTGNLQITKLYIEPGLLRLGVETVEQRVNDAYRNARAAARTAASDEYEKLLQTMGLTAEVMEQLDSLAENLQSGEADPSTDENP
jgi:DNA-binding protein YbaB